MKKIYKVFIILDKECLLYMIKNKLCTINISNINKVESLSKKSYVLCYGDSIHIVHLLLYDGEIIYPKDIIRNIYLITFFYLVKSYLAKMY